jgi:hypothetical protein
MKLTPKDNSWRPLNKLMLCARNTYVLYQDKYFVMDRDSSVGIATRYGLDVRGSNSCGARFSAPVQTGPGANQASYTVGTEAFPEVKRPGLGVYHPPPSNGEVKERVELYFFSLWACVTCSRVNCTFTFILLVSYIYSNLISRPPMQTKALIIFLRLFRQMT